MVIRQGFQIIEGGPDLARWVAAAQRAAADGLPALMGTQAQMRSGGTWCVGVDGLPNARDGSVNGVELPPEIRDMTGWHGAWHRAQLSVVFPGYPQKDSGESDAGFRYRVTRYAAHLDGLLPEGPARRRYLREPHAFVLGLPLEPCAAAPLMVWPGSHDIMGAALRKAVGEGDVADTDLTDAYWAARRAVFARIAPVAIDAQPGQAVWLHRHLLHGIAPWDAARANGAARRMVAYFRPQFSRSEDWLAAD